MGNADPFVSVIIPTYNRANFIKRAIDSVLIQNYENIEIIVVDDASTDNTESVVKGIKDSRIIYVKNDRNLGVSASRNKAIGMAKGEVIAFLDSDDYWLENKLKKQVAKLFSGRDIGLVYTGERFIDDRGKILREEIPRYSGYIYDVLLAKNFISPSSSIVRKDVLDDVGLFLEDLDYREDHELWLRISKKYKIDYVPEILTVRYIHSGGRLSDSVERKIRAFYRILDLYSDEFDRKPKAFSRQLYEIGKLYLKIGNKKEARRQFIRSFLKYPNWNALSKFLKCLF